MSNNEGRPPVGETGELATKTQSTQGDFPGKPVGNASEIEQQRLDDIENAKRFARQHRGKALYVPAWGWMVYDGKRWARDEGNVRVMELAKQTARSWWDDAEASNYDERLVKQAQASGFKSRLEAMISLAKSEPRMSAAPDDFDADPWALNVRNGTVNLRTGTLRSHDPADKLTKLSPVVYDDKAQCPHWWNFLSQVFQDDMYLILYAQRLAGYLLTGDVSEEQFWFAYGPTCSGKTKFVEVHLAMLGDQSVKMDSALFCASSRPQSAEAPSPNKARLKGIRFAAASETDPNRRLNEALLKELTGGDTQTACEKYKNPFDFRPTHKLMLATNFLPHASQDGALWRRVRVIPFLRSFAECKDTKLLDKLTSELPGILAWAVDGCLDWQSEGLGTCDAVEKATAHYRTAEDIVARFIDECCDRAPAATTGASDLYDAYTSWADATGVWTMKQTAFGRRLGELGFDKKNEGPRWVRLGLRLKHST